MRRLLLLSLLLLPNEVIAGEISMQFSVSLDWQFDLATNQMNPKFAPLTIGIQISVNDQKTGIMLFPPDTTRVLFGDVVITSPLSSLVDMRMDPTTLPTRDSGSDVQDTFITQTNQGTWVMLSEGFSGSAGSYGRWIQFTSPNRLPDPLSFSSDDFFTLLSSTANQQDAYGYREDSIFPGGGLQTHGQATLVSISRNESSIPEPATVFLMLVPTSIFLWKHQNRSHDRA